MKDGAEGEGFMTIIKGLAVLTLAALPLLGAAQTVYKYARPDGTVVYSDVPVHGARLIGQFQLVPLPVPEIPESRVQPGGKDPDEQARLRLQALGAADADIKAAEQALKDAQERQQAGVEPLEGERIGNVGGRTTRFGPEYFERQRQLADDVDAAQARLDQAYKIRNELRD
jgi:hypothetical protein